jgi:hypothetical protein
VRLIFAQLRQEYYGYTLRKALASRGMEIDEKHALSAAPAA